MIGLGLVSLVLVGCVAVAVSTAIGGLIAWLSPLLAGMEPKRRFRYVAGMLLAPAASGLVVLVLSFGPCLKTSLLGLPDNCERHGGPHLFLCLQHPVQASIVAWVLGAAVVARIGYVLAGVSRGAGTTWRLARVLRQGASSRSPDGYLVVPGRASFTAGCPRGEVFIGEALLTAVSPKHLAVVVAHEGAHQRRYHVLLKLAARAFAACHLPVVGRRLVEDLDAALEQDCDLEAARAVGDPLLVAESLIAVARFGTGSPEGALASFTDDSDSLSRRVEALCRPPSAAPHRARRIALLILINGTALFVLALALDRQLHDVTEALLQILAA